jgi:lipocalin
MAFKKQHVNRPLPYGLHFCKQFEEYHVPGQGEIVKTKSGDNCISVNGSIGLVRNFVLKEGVHYVVFQKFHSLEAFYTYPLDSTLLGIYKVSRLSRIYSVAIVSEISRKYVLLCSDNEDNNRQQIAVPLLHSRL